MYPFEYLTQKNIIESCTVEITDQCDFKCLHCDYPKKLNGKIISLPSAKIISNQLRKMNTFRITISGGEPFEHPEAIDIIKLFYENSFLVEIITNGFKVNQDQLEVLRNLPKLEVIFSIYGTLSVHEKITGIKGSFEKIIKNISFLKNGKCKVKTQTPVFTENFDNLEELSKLSAQLGVDISYDPYISKYFKK
ncbi:MAG: radical SAM protein [Endomicrobium sp.]|jgi:MoaA/NifB/PqqE/SkfB family radical SAM enzyme|nr:radical SAM protein [Endomicrobium sp.]